MDFDDDDAYVEEDWDDGDDESDVISCPGCGSAIYEDALQCPYCGDYVTADTSAWGGRPTWWIILGLLGILATILALSLGP